MEATDFYNRNPELQSIRAEVAHAIELLVSAFSAGSKLVLCGNGGSYADAEHIAGELGKSFLLRRELSVQETELFNARFGRRGVDIASRLERGLPVLVLSAGGALASAFANDADPALVYAQQAYTLVNPGDVLLGISTSGNAKNVLAAMMAAQVKRGNCIALTGMGGEMREIADCAICAPGKSTPEVQEQHIRIYHYICAAVERRLFA